MQWRVGERAQENRTTYPARRARKEEQDMTHFSAQAEKIPGLVTAGWIFNGTTMEDQQVSLVWLQDGNEKFLVNVTAGIGKAARADGLTPRMKSYLSGL